MTPKRVRVTVRCESCRASTILSPEQYRTLLKESRVALHCSRCAHRFLYTPIGMVAGAAEPPAPEDLDLPLDVGPPPIPAEEPTPALAVAFPPPPFAPLGVGAANPAKAPAPAFAPMGAEPAAPAPVAPRTRRAKVAADGERKSLTLNERWKRLPPWVQWTVVGLTVVVLAIVIFAVPVGGSGNGKPETPDSRPAKASPEPSASDKPPPQERQP